jgi:hypothetical protein
MNYPINFLNDNAKKNLEQVGRDSLDNVRDTLNMYLNPDSLTIEELLSDSDMNSDILDQIEEEKAEKSLSDEDNFNELSTYLQDDIREQYQERFYEYGLSFDYVELDKDTERDYFKYLLSYGGPSEEIRFYDNGDIEYVYLDWFCGVGFNVTNDGVFKLVRDWFKELDMLNFEQKRSEYDYYDILAEKAESEEDNEEE